MVHQVNTSLSWLDEEINASVFIDRRHARFKSLMQKLWRGMGNTISFACQDSAATKAAYRFLASCDKIDEQTLRQGHTEATGQRIRATKEETILLLQDTTTFGYHRDNPDAVEFAGNQTAGLIKTGNDAGI